MPTRMEMETHVNIKRIADALQSIEDGVDRIAAALEVTPDPDFTAPGGEGSDERFFRVTLSASQYGAVCAAAENAIDQWDGTAPEDIEEQFAIKAAAVALNNAEPIT